MRGWTWIVIAAGFLPTFAFAQDASSQKKTIGRPHSCEGYFPDDLRYDGAQGATTLAFTVTAEGGVSDITVAKSSGNAELDAAAVACASHWRYKPATRDTVPIAMPWKAKIDWLVPRKDVADQVHRNPLPVPPATPVEGGR